uniref:Nudix hydrolase domain-containing protein n=1 Tax=Macrostomum lignano TaxID=282301 RepID=A0A1I8FN90_9PLAT
AIRRFTSPVPSHASPDFRPQRWAGRHISPCWAAAPSLGGPSWRLSASHERPPGLTIGVAAGRPAPPCWSALPATVREPGEAARRATGPGGVRCPRRHPRVLLTAKRSTATDVILRRQVSFPGGKSDPGADAGPVATALREAAEEIGLSPGLVRVLAVLPVMPLGRHLVTPGARLPGAQAQPGPPRAKNPDEVDELLTPPLRWALPDGGAPAAGRLEFRSRRVGRWLDCDIPVLSLRPGLAVFGFTCHLLVLAACICHRRYPLYPLEPFCHGLLLLGLLVSQGLLLPDPEAAHQPASDLPALDSGRRYES